MAPRNAGKPANKILSKSPYTRTVGDTGRYPATKLELWPPASMAAKLSPWSPHQAGASVTPVPGKLSSANRTANASVAMTTARGFATAEAMPRSQPGLPLAASRMESAERT